SNRYKLITNVRSSLMAVNIHITIIELNALHTKRQNLFQELDAVIHLLMEAKHWGLRKSRNATSLASIKLIQASAVLDLTEDDFDFLTSNKVWIATDRSRARRCVEACVYGTLDFVGYPRFPAPVEFIAA